MWKMLQKKKAKDYVIATGKQYSVKHFITLVAKEFKLRVKWSGKGIGEKGYINNKLFISIDKRYFRPTEVESLKGNANLAKKELNWKPNYNINNLVKDMVFVALKNF